MTDIYQNAAQVVVWLGLAADESDRVIGYLTLIGKEYHNMTSLESHFTN